MSESMSRLFVIGNGFDLHFSLCTSVDDFKSILKMKKTYDSQCALDVFEGYGVDWSQYEDSLSNLDIDEIACDNLIAP